MKDATSFVESLHIKNEILEVLKPHSKVQDWKGHFRQGESFDDENLKYVIHEAFRSWWPTSPEEAEKLLEDIRQGKGLVDLPTPRQFSCPFCDEGFRWAFTGDGFVITNDPCTRPDGLVTEFELNVPSGKLVVANDLRRWFPCDTHNNVNSAVGCHQETLDHAEVGMAFGFVGNTCPQVFQDGDSLAVALYQEELWDGELGEYVENPKPCSWGKRVAGVCTDLWWYCMVDLEELGRRVAHFDPDQTLEQVLKSYWCEVVNVTPGVYKFRHDQGVDRDTDEVLFAQITRVRDPDPIRDFLAEDQELITASEYLIQQCTASQEALKKWKSASTETKIRFLAKAAGHLMVTIGNGISWHEKGFPRGRLKEETKSLAESFTHEVFGQRRQVNSNGDGEIPYFGFARWYPISREHSAICKIAGISSEGTIDASPSYVRLAMNICQAAILRGPSSQPHTTPQQAKAAMTTFWDAYDGLRKRYPDIVFEKVFDDWFSRTMREDYLEGLP